MTQPRRDLAWLVAACVVAASLLTVATAPRSDPGKAPLAAAFASGSIVAPRLPDLEHGPGSSLPAAVAVGEPAQRTATPSAAPTADIGTAAFAGTAAWYPAPGMTAALETFRFGDRPYRALVRGPVGTATVTIADHCACVVDGRGRLIDLSPAAFRATCGPLARGVCVVTLELL